MIRAREHPGVGGAGDVLDEIRIVVALRKGVHALGIVRVALIVIAGGAAAARANENEIPAVAGVAIDDLVGRPFEGGPVGVGEISLPGGDVDAQDPLLCLGGSGTPQQRGQRGGGEFDTREPRPGGTEAISANALGRSSGLHCWRAI
jgi:hypothetical protein